ncbi:MAG: hypothetical protein FWD17_13265, partial [Polyangiaceae bacterium]|nr:hypothetical protein [Polyangiaceae bacterium]
MSMRLRTPVLITLAFGAVSAACAADAGDAAKDAGVISSTLASMTLTSSSSSSTSYSSRDYGSSMMTSTPAPVMSSSG